MPLQALYQNIILEHYKNPRNFGKLHGTAVRRRHENPVCGDHIELYVVFDSQRRIQNLKFESWGCVLSRASASMMSVAVTNQTSTHAREMMQAFHAFFTSQEARPEPLGDLRAFAGVKEFPARIPCALLPWNALAEYLNGS